MQKRSAHATTLHPELVIPIPPQIRAAGPRKLGHQTAPRSQRVEGIKKFNAQRLTRHALVPKAGLHDSQLCTSETPCATDAMKTGSHAQGPIPYKNVVQGRAGGSSGGEVHHNFRQPSPSSIHSCPKPYKIECFTGIPTPYKARIQAIVVQQRGVDVRKHGEIHHGVRQPTPIKHSQISTHRLGHARCAADVQSGPISWWMQQRRAGNSSRGETHHDFRRLLVCRVNEFVNYDRQRPRGATAC